MKFSDAAIQGVIQGSRAIGRIAFPTTPDQEVGVRLLSERDIDLARFEAQMYLERQAKKVRLDLIDSTMRDNVADIVAIELLAARAARGGTKGRGRRKR